MTIGSDQLDAWGRRLIRRVLCLFHGHEYSETYTEYLRGYEAVFIQCKCGASIMAEIRNPHSNFHIRSHKRREGH